MHVHICIVYMHACVLLYMYMCSCEYMHICEHLCVCAWACVCICMYAEREHTPQAHIMCVMYREEHTTVSGRIKETRKPRGREVQSGLQNSLRAPDFPWPPFPHLESKLWEGVQAEVSVNDLFSFEFQPQL